MPLLAKLQAQRRIVIPKEVALHLRVEEGDVLLFRLSANGRAVIVAADIQPKEL